MDNLIINIGMVSSKIRRAALEEFLRCAQRVHTIAFLQWRMKWPSTLKRGQQRELIELIESRIVFMYGKLEKGIDPYYLPSSKYGCNEAFYEKFSGCI